MNEVDMEKIFKALSNRRRLSILKIIKNRPFSVGNIAKQIRLSVRSTSKHLSILYAAGFVEKEQKGLLTFYNLDIKCPKIVLNAISQL